MFASKMADWITPVSQWRYREELKQITTDKNIGWNIDSSINIVLENPWKDHFHCDAQFSGSEYRGPVFYVLYQTKSKAVLKSAFI